MFNKNERDDKHMIIYWCPDEPFMRMYAEGKIVTYKKKHHTINNNTSVD